MVFFVQVVLGGGRGHFRSDPTSGGKRVDGRDLIVEWVQDMGDKAAYVWNKSQLDHLDVDNTEHLLGKRQNEEINGDERVMLTMDY